MNISLSEIINGLTEACTLIDEMHHQLKHERFINKGKNLYDSPCTVHEFQYT